MKNFKLVILLAGMMSTITGHAYNFGLRGGHGHSGFNGSSGNSAESVHVLADGSSKALNLMGQHGEPGGPGEYGGRAYRCNQNLGFTDDIGAPGGAGGNGGDGGHGGRGGNAVIFYDYPEDLKAIAINNQGGRGAMGGSGAEGGRGCLCNVRAWTKKKVSIKKECADVIIKETCKKVDGKLVCDKKKVCKDVEVINTYSFRCFPGSRGSFGYAGNNGQDGARGSITLVQGLKEIPQENESGTANVVKLTKATTSLSKNIWAAKAGAKDLFAIGSNISDKYTEFVTNAKTKVKVNWLSTKDISDFSSMMVNLSFNGKMLMANFSSDYLVDYEVKTVLDGVSVITIKELYKKSDVVQLSASIEGSKSNFKIVIDDAAALSDIVHNKVHLDLRYKSTLVVWRKIFVGSVNPAKMTIKDNKIIIPVGKLGVKTNKLKNGKKIKFEISVERSFGSGSATVFMKQDKMEI